VQAVGSVHLSSWLLAVAPILLLLVLVLTGRLSAAVTGLVTAGAAVLVAMTAFSAGIDVVAVGVGKGLWTGTWILFVVWPALLVFHLTREMGLMRLGSLLSSILPRRMENVLIVGWIFPSLIQGVAGFGTPVAVAAPLLVTMGVTPVRAVALPLVGYHWSVGFGSMGSSFYMGALTGGLEGPAVEVYATKAALLLGTSAVLSGVLVCLVYSGWRGLREGWRVVLVAGLAMAVVQALAARLEPAIGAVSGAAAGLAAVALLRQLTRSRRGASTGVRTAQGALAGGGAGSPQSQPVEAGEKQAPDLSPRRAAFVLAPYVVLLVGVLAVYVPGRSRTWVKSNLLLGPSFPETVTAQGQVNAAVGPFTPIALLGHPGSYLLLSAVAGVLAWRVARVWPRGRLRPMASAWVRQALRSSPPVLLLATVATVMADTGMVRTIAVGAADVTGAAFPLVTPIIGLLGAFTTGSTTSSNALFAALQSEVAQLIDVPATTLLAGQLAGGNVGNIVAPMVLAIGVAGLGIRDRVGEVLRLVLLPAAVLAVAVAGMTFALAHFGT
jgi:lactate permease